MATRKTASRTSADETGHAPGKPRAPARKRVAAEAAAVDAGPEPQTGAEPGQPPASLWTAGLKALKDVRQDVERRQAGMIGALLGFKPALRDDRADAEPRPAGFAGLDAFGLRKFEDVFDQRVGAALARLGMPTRDELTALREQLDQVLTQLERLEALTQSRQADAPAQPGDATEAADAVPAPKPAPRRRAPRAAGTSAAAAKGTARKAASRD